MFQTTVTQQCLHVVVVWLRSWSSLIGIHPAMEHSLPDIAHANFPRTLRLNTEDTASSASSSSNYHGLIDASSTSAPAASIFSSSTFGPQPLQNPANTWQPSCVEIYIETATTATIATATTATTSTASTTTTATATTTTPPPTTTGLHGVLFRVFLHR